MLGPRAAAAAPCRAEGQCPLSAKILHRQVLDVYCMALNSDKPGRHGIWLRREFESEMRRLLFRYRDTGGTPLKRHVNHLTTSLPHLFTFLECPGVDPTNNAAERDLRPVVVSRRISGQIKRRPGLDGQIVCVHDMRAHVETAGQIPGRRGFKDDVGDVTSCDMCICVSDGFESCLIHLF